MTNQARATYFILLATLFWGMTFALIKDAVVTLHVFDFIFWRFLVGSLFMLIVFFKQIEFSNQKIMIQGILLGVFFGAGAITQTIALTTTTASTVSFITAFEVVIVPILICFLGKKWPSLSIIFAVIFTMSGVGFLTLVKNGFVVSSGNWWALACAFCFAIYTLLAGSFSHSGKPITLTFVQVSTLAIFTAFINLFSRQMTIPHLVNQWFAIIFCAIFASVFSFYLQIRFQRYLSATKTAIIFSAEPIFATLTAILYLHERLSSHFFIGALLILLGILLSELNLKKKIMPQD